MLGDNGYVRKFAYAAKRDRTINAMEYHTDSGPTHAVFSYMGLNIEDFFLTGIPPSPVERTYLTTGILEAGMRSHGSDGAQIETPHLAIRYTPAQSELQRPTSTRPTGASLSSWDMPEPGSTPAADSIPIGRDGTVRGQRR